jgi:Mn2+/Fe2+ NRAMP family transporter
MHSKKLFATLGPGMIVAATGVGAGDLATASLAGSTVGLAILWAVLVGALLKFVLNEGIARWQLATGSTLIEGAVERLGKPLSWLFLAYLVTWSFFVGAALMGAVGVTCHAMFPLTGTGAEAAGTDKIIYGVLFSLLAVVLVQVGGYKLFERVMSVCVGVMFVVIATTVVCLWPDWGDVAGGLFLPRIPPGAASWVVALVGGIGGTVTLLCYGYWIREEGRTAPAELATCRVDLAGGYLMTAVFGVGMLIIGNFVGRLPGGGATLVVEIAGKLDEIAGRAGPLMRWAFLAGAFGAVFSSVLGVWQSIPYLFADLWRLLRAPARASASAADAQAAHAPIDTRSWAYRGYLYAIALVPVVGMVVVEFRTMQKSYAIVGALFVPLLAAVLIVLNGRAAWVGQRYRNTWLTTLVLAAAVLFFAYAGGVEIYEQLAPPPQ